MIEELIALAKEMREADRRGEELGLDEAEVAFYDALETNDSAVAVLGDETLREIARELVAAVRANVTIDWAVRENVRAQLRVIVKRILRKHGYPPDKAEQATATVLEQAEALGLERIDEVASAVVPFVRLPDEEVEPYVNAIPLYSLAAAAGGFGDGRAVEPDAWVDPRGRVRPAEGLFVAQVVGESMNRRIPNGAFCVWRAPVEGARTGRVVLVESRRARRPGDRRQLHGEALRARGARDGAPASGLRRRELRADRARRARRRRCARDRGARGGATGPRVMSFHEFTLLASVSSEPKPRTSDRFARLTLRSWRLVSTQLVGRAPRPSSTCTSTPSTRSSTARAGSPTSSRGPASSRCRRSRSPTTARWPAPSSSVKATRGTGVKPVVGCEVYVADDRRAQTKGNAHLTLLAADNAGLREPDQALEPRLPRGLLLQAARRLGAARAARGGVIALSGCLSGRVCKALEENRATDAEAELDRLAQVFGRDNVYVELQNAHLDVQARILPQLVELAAKRRPADRRDRRRPLPAPRGRARPRGAPLHPVGRLAQEPEPLEVRDRPLLLQDARGDGARLPRPRRRDAAHARDRRALQRRDRARPDPAAALPDARRPRRVRLPRRALREGPRRSATARSPPSCTERLRFELKTIKEMGFTDYFLIVWDFIHFAKEHGISVGPGRGSAAGSLVAYCLEITDLDPIRYDLLFERFLNPGRKSMPDIDIDFAVDGRERVINYVTEKYGRDRVAQIITFSTMAARAAVRDAGRVLEVPYGVVDKIAKLIPEGPGQTLDECLKPGAELRKAVDSDPVAKEIVELARPLEGLTRADSIHAAGVVIGAEPLIERRAAPAEGRRPGGRHAVPDEGRRGARPAEDGLPRPAQPRRDRQGGRARRRRPRHRAIPMDDKKTYAMLARGEATGVFQFESSGMREALRQVKPTEFEDLIALVALYRPGPDAVHPDLREPQERQGAGHVPRPAAEADPRRDLRRSRIYQEQSMEIAKQIAGFSPAEADDLRKAIGKKIHSLMASLKDKFIEGCIANEHAPTRSRASSGTTWRRRRTTRSTSRTPPATR